MSLRLRQTIAGRPRVASCHSVATLSLDGKAIIAYTSSSNVVLVDHELELLDTLPFSSALPHRTASSSKQVVEGVVTHSQDKLILAWSGSHVVVWVYGSVKGAGRWIVHSTLIVSGGISSLDYKGGVLAVGTANGLEVWRHDPKATVVVWDRVWERHVRSMVQAQQLCTDRLRMLPSPSEVHISPSSWHIACYSKDEKCVRMFTVDPKGAISGVPQEMRHPRELAWIGWRKPRSNMSGDAHLYTITSNSVFRIYAPVLDDPAWFQLHLTLDGRAFLPPQSETVSAGAKGKAVQEDLGGMIWPLEADKIRAVIGVALQEQSGNSRREIKQMLQGLLAEESDVVMWCGDDGTLSLRSIVNMDRKPPTLLRSLPLSRLVLRALPSNIGRAPPVCVQVPSSSTLLAIPHPGTEFPELRPVTFSISLLLAADPGGMSDVPITYADETRSVQLSSPTHSFVRTPNGRGLMAMSETGELGVWAKQQRGKPKRGVKQLKTLLGRGQWRTPSEKRPSQCAIFAKGRAIVTCIRDAENVASIALQHLDPGTSEPSLPVPLPDFILPHDDDIGMLLAVSDIDDGKSAAGRRTQRAYIMAASESGEAWVWSVVSRRITSMDEHQKDDSPDIPEIILISRYKLPTEGEAGGQVLWSSGYTAAGPRHILPVDPMGWHQSTVDWTNNAPLQDMILTVSSAGTLEFWRPRLHRSPTDGSSSANGPAKDTDADEDVGILAIKHEHVGQEEAWTRSGVVHTGKTDITMARCSSRKKTVLVKLAEGGTGAQEMSIWDSNVSEFSTGLELLKYYDKEDIIQDLDWTTTSDLQSVLAVGFPHKIELVCEQRMSYVDDTPGWGTFLTIDLTQYTSVPINDSIWLAGGSLAVGAGNQIYLFSRFLDRESPIPTPKSSVRNAHIGNEEPEDIFQLIAHQNGPLLDYHPTVLAQCLLWNKLDLVKSILVDLRLSLEKGDTEGHKRVRFPRLDPMEFTQRIELKPAKKLAPKYDSLFETAPEVSTEDDVGADFNHDMVSDLIDRLEGPVSIPLTYSEKSMLATIAQATVEVERQRRSLDICGLRYLISLRMYVNAARRSGLSGTATPASCLSSGIRPPPRLSFRNIVWATHSESQDVMLSAATECCPSGKMVWADAKRLGVFLWLKSADTVKSQMEVLARNRFMMDEDRDPTSCSLIFFALGKKKVVHGLWRQAPGHKEQNLMLKFLANDFETDKWKLAAAKNAYALLSKQRYEYAAAFFMLAGTPKDAITVVLRQLDDWQLAFALARIVENGFDGPLARMILTDTVVPLAFAGGHRWLATWAFWTLGRRDLAVRVLIAPMSDVVADWAAAPSLPVGNAENDDPSLLLLFRHLKSKSLQTAKGTSEIKGKTEFDFVLHNARVFCRMGCHSLALDLLRSWSFDRPFFPPTKAKSKSKPLTPLPSDISSAPPPTPKRPNFGNLSPSFSKARRPSFMLAAHGRRESMVMDMDMDSLAESEAPTRRPSPTRRKPLDGVFADDDETPAATDIAPSNGFGLSSHQTPVAEEPKPPMAEPTAEPPKKMGNLMKELKQDVQQGAMEFNMDSFF